MLQMSTWDPVDRLGAPSQGPRVPPGVLRVRQLQATVVDGRRVRAPGPPSPVQDALHRGDRGKFQQRYVFR